MFFCSYVLNMFFCSSVKIISSFVILSKRSVLLSLLTHRQMASCAHLAVLVEYAVDAALTHCLRVVNMLRREASIAPKNHLYA